MPRVDILIESPIEPSFRVEQVRGMFDVPKQDTIRHESHVDIPVENTDWQVGLVVGPSGSGKTTIGRRLFPDALFHTGYAWPEEQAIVDGFPASLDGREITQALSSVGFSSPPHWLKRYAHLSNGQKFRCELARLMLEDADLVLFDEFTSVVDRDAAKVSSAAVAKALRRRGKPRLIALSCHYDIIDWLDPDWIYNTADGSFARRSLQGRPPIELRVHNATAAAWALFRGYH
jgi:ABC-type ATPase with predicted acetyltransferase domain